MSREKPRAETLNKHPEEYRQDLNPDAMAGQNIGITDTDPNRPRRTAYDIKSAHRRLSGILDDNLKQIPVLEEGTRLQQGATYIDLRESNAREFKALGNIEAGPDNWYVPKDGTPYHLWNLLIGIDNPERLDTGNE